MRSLPIGEGDRLAFLACCLGVVMIGLGAWWIVAKAALTILWMFWGIS